MKKRIIQILLLMVISTLLFLQCNNPPFQELKLVGLNDTAYYYVNPSTEKISHVVKKEYMFKVDYSVIINRDTLFVGQDFVGAIGVFRGDYKITIDEPENEIIEGTYKEPEKGEPHEALIYKFETVKTGNFNFKGIIEIDTLISPFEYKFIVIED
jgi:hypothetical protein